MGGFVQGSFNKPESKWFSPHCHEKKDQMQGPVHKFPTILQSNGIDPLRLCQGRRFIFIYSQLCQQRQETDLVFSRAVKKYVTDFFSPVTWQKRAHNSQPIHMPQYFPAQKV